MKKAIVFGVTGQTGSYMAELLLSKGYIVIGAARRVSVENTGRLTNTLTHHNFSLLNADVIDSASVVNIIRDIKPDEVYNYASQSHVHVSWKEPISTVNSVALGCLHCLEAIKSVCPTAKYFYAASSEEFGDAVDADGFQRITTPLKPNSPYAAAKVLAHNLVRIYRESYDMYACVALSANHECISADTPLLIRKNGSIFIKTPKDLVRWSWYRSNQSKSFDINNTDI